MKKRRIIAMMLVGMTCGWVWGEVTEVYYSSLDNKAGKDLFDAITSIAYTHHTTASSYNWEFTGIDTENDGTVIDIYSTYSYNITTASHNYSTCGTGINREHVVPQSLFEENSPQVGDKHHLFLVDGKTNGHRSSYAFGECSSGEKWCDKELGRLGTSTFSEYSSWTSSYKVFEPDDQYKGDIARAIMYMVARYATSDVCRAYNIGSGNSYPVTTWATNASIQSGGDQAACLMFANSLSSNYGLSEYSVALLMKWHRNDPVSSKEITRNNAVENQQGNRNPFIDYPYLAEYLWGKESGETVDMDELVASFSDEFIPGVSDGKKSGGGGTTYTDFLTDCAPAAQYTISFYDNLQHTDAYYPDPYTLIVNEESTFTFPTITDIIVSTEQKTSGTCEQRHYHFMGWVIEADKSHPTDDNIHASKSTSAAVTGAASYYAVWAREATE